MGGWLGWRLLVRNTPSRNYPPPYRCAGSRAPSPRGEALCWGSSSSPLPSLTLLDVFHLLVRHLPSDEPWGDAAYQAPCCLLGTPPPSPPGRTDPQGVLTLGCSVWEGMDEAPVSPAYTGKGGRG